MVLRFSPYTPLRLSTGKSVKSVANSLPFFVSSRLRGQHNRFQFRTLVICICLGLVRRLVHHSFSEGGSLGEGGFNK